MTNQAILSILNNLCAEARDSVHATFGLIDVYRDAQAGALLETCLDASRNSADHLLRSIDDVRDLLSGETPERKTAEEFDVAQCLQETIELVNLASGERGSRILLAPPFERVVIRQDRQAVEQLFARLLDAALKLSLSREVLVSIGRRSGEETVLELTPPDAGLSADFVYWLNGDPERINLPSGYNVSFAVAVIVAGRLLRTIGGTAEAVSAPATPAGDSAIALAVRIPSQPALTGAGDFHSGGSAIAPDALNILVAEDSDESYVLSEIILQKENVCRARNGIEAVEFVKKHRFDVVFMDVHMPGMDGYSAVRAIRDWETQTANARTAIVVLSSDDLETQKRSAAQSGCSGFLRKPVLNNDLLDLVQRFKAARTSLA